MCVCVCVCLSISVRREVTQTDLLSSVSLTNKVAMAGRKLVSVSTRRAGMKTNTAEGASSALS